MIDSKLLEKSSSQTTHSGTVSFWGLIFPIFGFISFLVFLYSAILSKLLSSSGNQILSAIQNDRYYCMLVPLTIPAFVVAVYLQWLSMKLFKHA